MLKIHKQCFTDNLKLTQAYCDMQMQKDIHDIATVFRSYNPVYGDKQLFTFESEEFCNNNELKPFHYTETKWLVDPTDKESIVNRLYEDQINHKDQFLGSLEIGNLYPGKILIAKIDCTVIDGASVVQSLGLIDGYDIPPVDTWFYMTQTEESRVLFAWIPMEYVNYANDGVEVNCVDCINWADTWYPEGLEAYFSSDDNLLSDWRTPAIGNTNSRAEVKTMSIWLRIRRLFGA